MKPSNESLIADFDLVLQAEQFQDTLLEDMICPKCGERHFNVEFKGTCRLMRDGSDDCGDHEWGQESACVCQNCGHGGLVSDFTFDGLDAAIEDLKP